MSSEPIAKAFDLQTVWCQSADSPFMVALMQHCAADLRSGGPLAALIGDWPGNPIADALMMRVAGALHAAALTGRDQQLAALYPDNNPDWDIEKIWRAALAFFTCDADWVRVFLQSPPQTNETRRSIALLPGFLALAPLGPLHLLELGASAGLNLNWDKFRYETESWSWGPVAGALMSTDWRGAPPEHLGATLQIASRAACDRNPLDVRNDEHLARLRAYLWADQPWRRARFDAAVELARAADVRVDAADAGDWLKAKLRQLPGGVTVVYHSIVWQYFSPDTKAAATAAIDAAAARADDAHRLALLRYEPNILLGLAGPVDEYAIQLTVWPGGEPRILAHCDGHARWVQAV